MTPDELLKTLIQFDEYRRQRRREFILSVAMWLVGIVGFSFVGGALGFWYCRGDTENSIAPPLGVLLGAIFGFSLPWLWRMWLWLVEEPPPTIDWSIASPDPSLWPQAKERPEPGLFDLGVREWGYWGGQWHLTFWEEIDDSGYWAEVTQGPDGYWTRVDLRVNEEPSTASR